MAKHVPRLDILWFAAILLVTVTLNFCTAKQFQSVSSGFASPLYTDSRWIVDKSGKRVKLACVNWPGHLQPVLPEGLHKQPVDAIILKVKLMGFNCVRLTWPGQLATNNTLASLTVEQSFKNLGLTAAIAGLAANNPWILDLTLMNAFKAVLASCDRNQLMVVLDNHITVPGWCCGFNDGNGFFGDVNFDPTLWKQGLHNIATMATQFRSVIGMSLRNELRGPKSNVNDWYKNMQEGAETVHAANPNVLVILSGLDYDKDLSFLNARPINVTFTRKLVFEMHWYSFSHSGAWGNNLNDACGRVGGSMMQKAGFLTEKGYPLFVSEFGADGRGVSDADNKFLNCFMGMAADQDWDFAVWTLQGSYYLREGVVEKQEAYGLLDFNWAALQNPNLLRRLSGLQPAFRGPGLVKNPIPHKIIFHPLTGMCIQKGLLEPLRLGPCQLAQAWIYSPHQKTLRTLESPFFLKAVQPAKPASLHFSLVNDAAGLTWDAIAGSKNHLSTKTSDGATVCLDMDENGYVVTNNCKCLSGDNRCDPSSQWFKMIESTRF